MCNLDLLDLTRTLATTISLDQVRRRASLTSSAYLDYFLREATKGTATTTPDAHTLRPHR